MVLAVLRFRVRGVLSLEVFRVIVLRYDYTNETLDETLEVFRVIVLRYRAYSIISLAL